MKIYFKRRLGFKGHMHILVPMVAAVLIGVLGTFFIVSSHAASSDAAALARRTQPKHALIFGDSLTWESNKYINSEAKKEGWDVRTHTFPGTAPCDWVQWMDQ